MRVDDIITIQDFKSTTAKALGSKSSEATITDAASYYKWLDSGLNSLVAETQQAPPILVMINKPIILGSGVLVLGTVLFQDAYQREPTAFEYRTAGQTEWKSCTSFEFQIPNVVHAPGDIQLRAKATATKQPSRVITNGQQVDKKLLEIEVLSINGIPVTGNDIPYQAHSKEMRWEVESSSDAFVRMHHSNAFLYGGQAGDFHRVLKGRSLFVQDVSFLSGQRRLWLVKQGAPDFVTPKYSVNLEP